jgi:phosphoserine phosphatase
MAVSLLTAIAAESSQGCLQAIQTALRAAMVGAHDLRDCAEGRGVQCLIDGDAALARAALLPLESGALDLCLRQAISPRVFVADMDATIVQEECLDELASMAGVGDRVAALTAEAMAGGLDFAAALRARLAILADAGADRALIRRTLRERIHLQPGAATLLATLRSRGVRCVLVSGGFKDFVEPVARTLGFDAWHCNRFSFSGELVVGVTEPIVGREAKLELLGREAGAGGLDAAVAIGDGANDIPMLLAAGTGIAFHAKPRVAAAVPNAIRHGDLTTVLHFLGIPETEWVKPTGSARLTDD